MSFLYRVAETYYHQYGDSLKSFAFVFPNRRAGLFFRKYLAQTASHPLFSPRILTIEQLFQELSPLKIADPIDLLFRLYEIYKHEYLLPHSCEESFDNFLFWGRMMLSDFNDVDSHLVNADKLFTNLSDQKDIDLRFANLGEEQHESIRIFLKGFQTKEGNHYREQFLNIWRALLPIYNSFRDNLRADGLAYSGMLARDVVENSADDLHTDSERYIFVGFNALNGAQKALLSILRDAGKADFCWDYDHWFLRDPLNRASLFMQENLRLFPNKVGISTISDNKPKIHLIQISSAVGQTAELTSILSSFDPEVSNDWTKVGVVLPDENMLTSIRHAIPACVNNMNITMGQPLSCTPVSSLLMHLSELQLLCRRLGKVTLFYHRPTLALLSHPYIVNAVQDSDISDLQTKMQTNNMTYVPQAFFENNQLLKTIFLPQDDAESTLQWLRSIMFMLVDTQAEVSEQNEYLYQTLLQINRLSDLCKHHPEVKLNTKVLLNLLIGLINSVRVPFEGEPLAGLQIMGMLESRGMDFSHLIITDVNEDTLPGSSIPQSYIPYDLRVAYGLHTPERQDAVFAYNFFRLISCAEQVWLLQNTTANDMRSGEVSRYVFQLEYQYNLPIDKQTINQETTTPCTDEQTVKKTERVIQELRSTLCPPIGMEENRGLSPSALNTYMACPLKFYLTHIRHLREQDKIDEEMQENNFGTVVHEVMQDLYQPFCGGKEVNTEDIDRMLVKVKQTDLIERKYKLLQLKNEHSTMEGKDYLPINVMRRYIENVLYFDKTLVPFVYLASELKCGKRLNVPGVGDVYIGGKIDRIDYYGYQIRVIDYKTGKNHSTFKELQTLFASSDKQEDSDHVRQTLTYCLIAEERPELKTLQGKDMFPYIYYVRKKGNDLCVEISPKDGNLHGYSAMKDEFEKSLTNILSELFNADIPFSAKKGKNCEYCPFQQFCQ